MTEKKAKAKAVTEDKSIVKEMADKYGMDTSAFTKVLMSTVMPSGTKPEQTAAFLIICNRYDLDPFSHECWAFPDRGGVKPMISIDGFITIANRDPAFDGMEHEEVRDKDGNLEAITCRIYRKDRSKAISATEYMVECRNEKSPVWRKYPRRLLRHRATIQAIRLAFGLAGLADQQEYADFQDFTKNQPQDNVVDLNQIVNQ